MADPALRSGPWGRTGRAADGAVGRSQGRACALGGRRRAVSQSGPGVVRAPRQGWPPEGRRPVMGLRSWPARRRAAGPAIAQTARRLLLGNPLGNVSRELARKPERKPRRGPGRELDRKRRPRLKPNRGWKPERKRDRRRDRSTRGERREILRGVWRRGAPEVRDEKQEANPRRRRGRMCRGGSVWPAVETAATGLESVDGDALSITCGSLGLSTQSPRSAAWWLAEDRGRGGQEVAGGRRVCADAAGVRRRRLSSRSAGPRRGPPPRDALVA